MISALGLHASTVVGACERGIEEDADGLVDIPIPRHLPPMVQGLYPECELYYHQETGQADRQYPKWQASARLRTLVPVRHRTHPPLLMENLTIRL